MTLMLANSFWVLSLYDGTLNLFTPSPILLIQSQRYRVLILPVDRSDAIYSVCFFDMLAEIQYRTLCDIR